MMLSPYAPGSVAARRTGDLFVSLRAEFSDLQRQLATGRRAETFGGLGFDRRTSLDVRAKLSGLEGFQTAIKEADLRLHLMTSSVAQLTRFASESRSEILPARLEAGTDGRTIAQNGATGRLKEAIDLLNQDVNGRHLFSGRAHDRQPVASFEQIMNGAPGQAGLKTLIAERRAADRGDGLGRMTAGPIAGGIAVSSTNALPFGLKVLEMTTTIPTATAGIVDEDGVTTATLQLPANPPSGEGVGLSLRLPDGTIRTLTLTARAAADPPTADTFAIDPLDPAATRDNLMAALDGALRRVVDQDLAAASAMVAGESFFAGSPSAPPMRVAGSPPEAATALVAGTAADTMIWYRGDDTAPSARATAPVRIDATQTVGAGAQANEEGIRGVLTGLAVLAAESFQPTDGRRFEALADRLRTAFTQPTGQKAQDIGVELANAQSAMKGAKERHTATAAILQETLGGIEEAKPEEVAAALMALQTRLQASYQTSSILSKLSLVNFM